MKRKIYERLLEWKRRDARKVALLIDGARRVGKSWIAEEFGKNEYESHLLIDFRLAGDEVKEMFRTQLDRLDDFFFNLSAYYNVRLVKGRSLIIFDEIQFFPRAREAIKWLVKDGRFDYLETGSLVSIDENVKDIQVPSEERRIGLGPMDWEEFLWATGNELLLEALRRAHEKGEAPPNAIHRRAMELVRQYMVVGGMPQAVGVFVAERDLAAVDRQKRDILDLYRNDIAKHAGRMARKVRAIFDGIPSQLNRHDRVYRLSSLGADARFRSYEDAFLWLDDARGVNTAYNATEPTIGLKASSERSTFKLYMGDSGLLTSLSFDEDDALRADIQRRVLYGNLEANLGALMENLVAQMIVASGRKLYFYARSDNENAAERMEIDFLVTGSVVGGRHNVSAIEVKKTKRITTSSLDKFRKKFSDRLSRSYIVHTGAYSDEGGVLRLPVYMLPLELEHAEGGK